MDDVAKALLQSLLNARKDLVVIFEEGEPFMTNSAFNHFFSVKSLEQYKGEFGPFVQNFVPHPSYFNQDKIAKNENWLDAIMREEEQERIVSMLNARFEPRAFLVGINRDVASYQIVSFEDITQNLIKRIMIQNNATTDEESGAYAKNYFLQIMRSFDDAAAFNEKIIGLSFFEILDNDGAQIPLDETTLKIFTKYFKSIIRKDDMLVRWEDNSFLLVYLVDDEKKAKQVQLKFQDAKNKKIMESENMICHTSHILQKEKQSIVELIKKL